MKITGICNALRCPCSNLLHLTFQNEKKGLYSHHYSHVVFNLHMFDGEKKRASGITHAHKNQEGKINWK